MLELLQNGMENNEFAKMLELLQNNLLQLSIVSFILMVVYIITTRPSETPKNTSKFTQEEIKYIGYLLNSEVEYMYHRISVPEENIDYQELVRIRDKWFHSWPEILSNGTELDD